MRNLNFLLLDGLVAVYAAFDLIRTLKSGRARTWNGTATREHQT